MPLYEHVFLSRQDVSQQQVETLMGEFKQLIEEGGGKVSSQEYWGLKTLAYKIKKNRKAHFSMINIDAPPAAVAEMERRMGLSQDILRFMTVSVEEHSAEPSVQMRKTDRDDRGGRGGPRGDRGDRGGDRGDRGDRGGDRGGRGGPRPGGDRDRGGERPSGGDRGGERGGSTFRPRPQ